MPNCDFVVKPVHLLAVTIAGWLSHHQEAAIEFLREENRILRSRLPSGRMQFTDEERLRLAVRGQKLGRRFIKEIATIVTPETILRWQHRLVAAKWTFKPKTKNARGGLMKKIARHVVRFGTENPTWGYKRIQGALKNLGHIVAPNTVKKALKDAGLDPALERGKKTTWRTSLKSHAELSATTFCIFWSEFSATAAVSAGVHALPLPSRPVHRP